MHSTSSDNYDTECSVINLVGRVDGGTKMDQAQNPQEAFEGEMVINEMTRWRVGRGLNSLEEHSVIVVQVIGEYSSQMFPYNLFESWLW